VDATNNFSGGPAGLEIAELLPDARYVKAFNTVFATFMHDTPPGEPEPTLVYCGDGADAKAVVAGLIADLGFEPVDVGGAEATPWIEALARITITLAYGRGRGPFVYRFQAS
jgi:predicted dinucleotide-binding enzyme